ncbi:hypothetical protein FOZ62_001723, partial [Perkinsus olseni]
MAPTSSSSSTASTDTPPPLIAHADVIAKLNSEEASYATSVTSSNYIDLKCMVYDLNTDASPYHTVLVCLESSKRVDESAVLARLGLASPPKSTLTMSSNCEASV